MLQILLYDGKCIEAYMCKCVCVGGGVMSCILYHPNGGSLNNLRHICTVQLFTTRSESHLWQHATALFLNQNGKSCSIHPWYRVPEQGYGDMTLCVPSSKVTQSGLHSHTDLFSSPLGIQVKNKHRKDRQHLIGCSCDRTYLTAL